MKDRINAKLLAGITIQHLEVIDESYLHGGHNNFDGSPGSHFRLIIKSQELLNLPKVKAHQKIYKTLAEEMQIIHALAIELS